MPEPHWEIEALLAESRRLLDEMRELAAQCTELARHHTELARQHSELMEVYRGLTARRAARTKPAGAARPE